MLITVSLFLLLIFGFVQTQKPSPCPEIFSYEPRNLKSDRWYGVILLKSKDNLDGVWLKIQLDRPADLLGNQFGESVTSDNQNFLIKNPKYKLQAGIPTSIRFFIKYNTADIIPSLKSILINAKTICEEDNDVSTPTSQWFVSQKRPSNKPEDSNSEEQTNWQPDENENSYQQPNRRPPGGDNSYSESPNIDREQPSSLNSNNEETSNPSEFFPGDFAIFKPPQTNPTSRPSTIDKRQATCGTVAMQAAPLISHGQNTTKGQWPWHAALYHAQGAQLLYTCGATLISEIHIITAAHCVAKPQTKKPVDAEKLAIYLGKHSLKKFGEGTQDREVSDIFIHPSYNYSVFFNDIAILKLKSPVDFTNYVRPCCLWQDDIALDKLINRLGTVVGWGFDEKRQISDSLVQAQMPVISTVDCIYSNRDFFSQFTFDKNYCAGFRNGTTVCNGDSGGGMVFPKSTSSKGSPIWQIRGIVSVGVALQGQGVCDPSHYIVFTDVAKHLEWIRQTMKK